MNSQHKKNKIISALIWKFLERIATQGVQFVIQIVLARLLFPEDYGKISLVLVFVNLASVFVQGGLNTALIQKKDADEIDFSSTLYLSLLIALILYTLLFIFAPIISNFYEIKELAPILRVLGVILFSGAFNSIQNAIVSKYLLFRKLFISSFISGLISGLIGIYMAYNGYGIWALVAQQISNSFLITIIMCFTIKWRPKLVFSIKRMKTLFSFGSKLLLSNLIETLYQDSRTLLIGKIYLKEILGYYNRGEQIPRFIITNLNGSIQSVLLPTLSSEQNNTPRVKQIVRRSIVTSTFLVIPAMIGLVIIAEPLVLLLLTEKWLPAVPFIQIFAFSYALYTIHTANLQAINALGRSDIFLKLEIIKKVVGIILLIISIPFGIYALAITSIINSLISSFINAYPNKQLLNYSYKEQVLDIMPALLISLLMGVIISLFNFVDMNVWIKIILQFVVGIAIYLGLAFIFKLESLQYLINTVKGMFTRTDINEEGNSNE